MRLSKLQNNDKKAKKLRVEELSENWEDIREVLYYQNLLYITKIICSKLISSYYDNLLANHFEIKKTQELIV